MVKLVVGHQDLAGLQPVVVHEGAHGAPAAVHVGMRLQQPQLAPVDAHAARLRIEALVIGIAAPVPTGEFVDEPEARVVTRPIVAIARVAEPDDNLNGWVFSHSGKDRGPSRRRPSAGLRRSASSLLAGTFLGLFALAFAFAGSLFLDALDRLLTWSSERLEPRRVKDTLDPATRTC